MSFPLTISIDPSGLPLATPVPVTVMALGEDRALLLEPDGEALVGTLALPSPPRFVRLHASCDQGAAQVCLDQLVFAQSTDHQHLWLVATQTDQGLSLQQHHPGGLPTALQLGWGAGLLGLLGLLWLKVGPHART